MNTVRLLRRPAVVGLGALVALCFAAPAAAGAVTERRCQSVTNDAQGEGEGAATNIRAAGIGCAGARRAVRRCLQGVAGGYRVSRDARFDVRLHDGRVWITYTPVGGGGCEPEPRRCGAVTYAPNTDWGALDVEARYVRCRVARRVARAAKRPSAAQPPYRFRHRGFTCKGHLVEGGQGYVRYACRRGDASITFRRT